jgi:hypothetical protein
VKRPLRVSFLQLDAITYFQSIAWLEVWVQANVAPVLFKEVEGAERFRGVRQIQIDPHLVH